MTEDLRTSIALMRDVVERLRERTDIDARDRDTMIAILEEQIRDMEQRQAEQAGAWS